MKTPRAPSDHPCAWTRRQLDAIIELDRRDRDALPGSVMKHIKAARKILVNRHKQRPDKGPKVDD